MRDHRKLKAFQLADELAIQVYKATEGMPREEMYGLTSQLRRAALSASTNMVEGCARFTKKDYLHFLTMAFGSLRELGYLVSFTSRLGFLKSGVANGLLELQDQAILTLGALLQSLRRK